MSTSQIPPLPGITSGLRLVRDTDCDATPEKNVLGKPGTIFMIVADNPNGAIEYVKLYDLKDMTMGTDAPDITIPVAANSKKTVFCPSGVAFETGLCFGCVSDGGGTAGTTNPASDVAVSIMAQDS